MCWQDVALWHIKHDDGDEEDLEEHEVQDGIIFEAQQRRHCAEQERDEWQRLLSVENTTVKSMEKSNEALKGTIRTLSNLL